MIPLDKILLLDGAMGTCLTETLPPGAAPETLNITDPSRIIGIHQSYITAGAQVIYTNTFGANPEKIKISDYSCEALVQAGVDCAKTAAEGTGVLVALDCGPTGRLLKPAGDFSFESAYAAFAQMMLAGQRAGADLIVLETFSQLEELRAALLAARENTNLPVFCTLSFEQNGRTFSGAAPGPAAVTLTALGAAAIGVNCSLGPEGFARLCEEMRQFTHLPILAKPNAGLPDPLTGEYPMDPETFATLTAKLLAAGADMVGGCCGTTPAHIAALGKACAGYRRPVRAPIADTVLCSAGKVHVAAGCTLIGERINPTGKKAFKQALRDRDMDFIKKEALSQTQAGANVLDINVGLPDIDETDLMLRAIESVGSVCDLPLQLDSADAEVLAAGLRAYCGKALVNSVNGEQAVLDRTLPLVKKYGAAVVGLTLDETGIPETAAGRLAIARRIVTACEHYGIARRDILIDPLTLTVSAQPEQALETLEALRQIRAELGVKTVLGVSNISFGLPARQRINSTFFRMAKDAGLDFAILNPAADFSIFCEDAAAVLRNEDPGAAQYIARHGQSPAPRVVPHAKDPLRDPKKALYNAILEALKNEAEQAAKMALATFAPQDLMESALIPALDEVGRRFETGKIFLPALLACADAAGAAFTVLREQLERQGVAARRGPVVIATVKGDIHDIGKNIAKVMLQNYGFKVIDLGRDVPPAQVLAAAKEYGAPLVGLSALMTTTVKAMAQTVELLHRECGCKVFVAGAVLTEGYARQMGADYYAKDAKASVDIANLVCG